MQQEIHTDQELLQILTEENGFPDEMDMLETAVTDSIVPAICRQCLTTYEYEPDQDRG